MSHRREVIAIVTKNNANESKYLILRKIERELFKFWKLPMLCLQDYVGIEIGNTYVFDAGGSNIHKHEKTTT